MAIKSASATVTYLAWDVGNGAGKTGDVANHTLRLVSDGTEATPGATPTEVDATNLPGIYKVVIAAGENSGYHMMLGGKSSTTDIIIYPSQWENRDTNATLADAVWDEAMSGHVTAATAGAYMARIGTASVAVTSPVADDDSLDFYAGDDLHGSRALIFTVTGYVGDSLATGHTGTFRLTPKTTYDMDATSAATLNVALTAGTIVQSGTTVTVTVTLTDVQTALLTSTPPKENDYYQYQIRVSASTGMVYTLVNGTCTARRIIGASA